MGAAWIAAFAMVAVAIIGVFGNWINSRWPRRSDAHAVEGLAAELNIVQSLSELLAQEREHRRLEHEQAQERISALERRLAVCEALQQAREP